MDPQVRAVIHVNWQFCTGLGTHATTHQRANYDDPMTPDSGLLADAYSRLGILPDR